MKQLIDDLMDVSESIRYVAVYLDGKLESVAKPETEGASSSESDRYEELLVNPGILTLTRQHRLRWYRICPNPLRIFLSICSSFIERARVGVHRTGR